MLVRHRNLPLACGIVVYLLALGVQLMTLLGLTGGRLVYALDDPYIHLDLAQRIAHGEYAFNQGEFTAPASSILYPFLLVPFVALGSGVVAPLLWNMVGAIVALVAAARLLERSLRPLPERLQLPFRSVCLILVVLVGNLVGQTLQGMEHLLQLAATLWALEGIVGMEEGEKAPRWLPLALTLGPLLRFENLFFSALGIAYVAWRRQPRLAAAAALGISGGVGGFILFLKAHGSGPMPNSVTIKGIHHLSDIPGRLLFNVRFCPPTPWLMGLAFVLLGAALWKRSRLAAIAGFVLLAQLCGGMVGFARYEIYAIVLVAVMATYLLARSAYPRLAPLALIVLSWFYVPHTLEATFAAGAIYEQQYQMGRFVRERWKGPVAVNDIGLVKWQNPSYVVDLVGLANTEAMRYTLRNPNDRRWIGPLVEKHQAELALVYDFWFRREFPASWVKVGELYLSQPNGYLGGNYVSFYATRPEAASRLREELTAFRPSLPERVTLLIGDELNSNEAGH